MWNVKKLFGVLTKQIWRKTKTKCDYIPISVLKENEDQDRLHSSFFMWNRKLKQASQILRGSCTRKTEDDCADFISELPDHVLLHIFSFLDEAAVFQCSVLSERWRYLWTLVPFPMAIKEMRSALKKQKAVICEEKLRKEEKARSTISEITFDVATPVILSFLTGLSFAPAEFRVFVVLNLIFTIRLMLLMYSACYDHYSSLCALEQYLKRLQMRDLRLTSNAKSLSTTTVPMMELLFPENYEPRYAKSAKVYGLTGTLLMFMISCGLMVLKLNFDFTRGIGPLIAILSGFGSAGVVVFYVLKNR